MDSPPHDNRQRAADLMTTAIPRAAPADSVARALSTLQEGPLEEAGHLYLVDAQGRLAGQVPVERLLAAGPEQVLSDLQGPPPLEVSPDDVAESAALLAVERHEADVTVVDEQGRLLGAIPIGRLLALLHEEHVDDMLRKGGVGPAHPSPTEPHRTIDAFRARIPWLILGLVGGWAAAGIVGMFEKALQQEIALAFFLPLVVYMADAVGTQTETVLVRTLAYGRVPVLLHLWREGLVGLLIGGTVGIVAGLGLYLFGGYRQVALVISITLLATSCVATLVATLLPLALDRLGVDPALASGPIATVLQDLLSVAMYLGIATALL
jgi:magnesium transporter